MFTAKKSTPARSMCATDVKALGYEAVRTEAEKDGLDARDHGRRALRT